MNENAMTTMQPTLMASGEVATSAETAQAVAIVQSRYVMARAKPRNLESVRVSLLQECKRPGFAEVAKYHLPFGEGVSGPSIRFAEAVVRCMTNLWAHTMVTFDDDAKRVLSVSMTDLETNVSYEDSLTIKKTVERRRLKEGQPSYGTRLNSKGHTLYIVEATEGEIRAKQAAEVSKAIRTLSLRHLPGDIFEAAMAQVEQTARSSVANNPDDARRKLIDAFAAVGVNPEHLVTFLRHPLEQTTPAEVEKLRGIYAAVKEGQVTWTDVVMHSGMPDEPSKTSRTADTLKNRREKNGADQPPPQPPRDEPPQQTETDFGPPPLSDEEAAAMTGGDDEAGF